MLGTNLSSHWKQACWFEKKPWLFYLLGNVPCGTVRLSLFCMAYYSQGKKSDARGITVHLSASACGCRSCKEYITHMLLLKSCSFVPLSRELDPNNTTQATTSLGPVLVFCYSASSVRCVWVFLLLFFFLNHPQKNIFVSLFLNLLKFAFLWHSVKLDLRELCQGSGVGWVGRPG